MIWKRNFLTEMLTSCAATQCLRDPSCVPRGKKFSQYSYNCGPGSSVGIATDYGLDGPASNPG